MDSLEEPRPKPEVQRALCGHRTRLRGGSNLLLPVVGLYDDVEERRRFGLPDADYLELDTKEVRLLTRVFVQPVKRLSVLLWKDVAIQTIVDADVPAAYVRT